jgi:hypothetical protein
MGILLQSDGWAGLRGPAQLPTRPDGFGAKRRPITQFSRLYRLELFVGLLGLDAKPPFTCKASINIISIKF